MPIDPPSHRALIALGSNLGDRAAYLEHAIAALRAAPGIVSVRASRFHETAPVGGPPGQGAYLNAAAAVETTLGPEALLEVLLTIESELGRIREERWGPRTIDLDLLLYEDCVISTPRLMLPHPRMHDRRFVLAPLAEVAPDARHPVLGRTVRELLERLGAE